VIGFLSAISSGESTPLVAAFNRGLNDDGFFENRNVRIEYRWAEGRFDQLPRLASDLVNQQVDAIVAVGDTMSVYAARTATSLIPIIFVIGDDPVQLGLAESLAHPRGNLTGVTSLVGPLGPKRLEILRQVLPDAHTIALLSNPHNPAAKDAIKAAQNAASAYQVELLVQSATSDSELETAFTNLARQHAAALMVDSDPFFTKRRGQLVALAGRYAIPTIYPDREFAVSGGLMSYGGDIGAGYRDAGRYIGRILKGAKPADLPVQQPTKSDFVVNLKTAMTLGLTMPSSLLGRADEVIE
jgi:putative ABC transport system substrate-binding protein